MPVYTVTTQEGRLTDEQKKRLAEGITRIHSAETGALEKFVRVIFLAYPAGSGFLADEPNATSVLTGYIRSGRDAKTKAKMLIEFWSLYREITGARKEELAIFLEDVRASQAMEFGAIMPEPGAQEQEWLARNA